MTVYLDHAAATPLRPEARDAWVTAAAAVGNASSVHGHGQAARRVLEEAREALAEAVDCDPIEVVFTSGGTESVNLALKGLWHSRPTGVDAVVLPDGEHHATLDTVAHLAAGGGAEVRPVPLDPAGTIVAPAFESALTDAAVATALVANNETGALNDVEVLAAAAARHRVALHLDAIAAFGSVDVSFRRLRGDADPGVGLCALSLSAHKVGGPAGIGALVVSRTARLAPQLHGGGHQRRLRAGSQDVAGAAAFAAAATTAVSDLARESARLTTLRDELIQGILAAVPDARLLGPPTRRLPGNAHIHFPGAPGETLLFLLDQRGISVSTGSACQAGVTEPSHVVLALGEDAVVAGQVLRMTLGHTSTSDDVAAVLATLPAEVARARAAFGGRGGTRS
ncbi:aminotransferase class V-fold PLP-dependent enzyme [Microbacterium chocolatum]|uniref:cysteine desulfurase family protein n=1 Tax=Microbacterium aurantiacum TaxID=162393 RepID=UPI00338D9268